MPRPDLDVAIDNTLVGMNDATNELSTATMHLIRAKMTNAPSEMSKCRAVLVRARNSINEAINEMTRAEECC